MRYNVLNLIINKHLFSHICIIQFLPSTLQKELSAL